MNNFLARVRPYQLLVLSLLIVGSAYVRTVSNGFVWDDITLVEINTQIGDWDTAPGLFFGRSVFEDFGAANKKHIYYKPILGVWWMLNYTIAGGPNAVVFHVLQLGLHLVNVAIVFTLTQLILKESASATTAQSRPLIAFFVSLLWGLHPANSESVLYIAGGQEPLYLFFGLISFFILLKRVRITETIRSQYQLSPSRAHSIVCLIVGLFWLLSLLSKEAGIVVAPIMILYLFIVAKERSVRPWIITWIFVLVIYFGMRFGLAGVALHSTNLSIPMHRASLIERLFTVVYVLSRHLEIMVIPKALFIDNNLIIRSVNLEWILRFSGVIMGTLVMLALSLKNRLRLWIFLSGIISLGLVSNVFPLDMTHSDRWVYLPSMLFIGFWMSIFLEKLRAIKILWFCAGMVIILFFVRVWVRVPDWKDQFSIMQAAVQHEAGNYQAMINLSKHYGQTGDLESELFWLTKALEVNPYKDTVYVNLGVNAADRGDHDAEVDYYLKAIEMGNHVIAWENLIKRQYLDKNPEWIQNLEKALRYYPGNPTLQTFRIKAQTEEAWHEYLK